MIEEASSGKGDFLYNLICRAGTAGLIISQLTINGTSANAVIDTGATGSFLPLEGKIVERSRSQLKRAKTNARVADNGELDASHYLEAELKLQADKKRIYEAVDFSLLTKRNTY